MKKYLFILICMVATASAPMAQVNRFPQYNEQPQAVTLNLADDTNVLLVEDGEHTLCGNVVFYTFDGTIAGAGSMIALTGGSQNASATNTPPAMLCRLLQAYHNATLTDIQALYRSQDAATFTSIFSSSVPGPTARTSAICGFSCALPGRTIPLAVFSSATISLITTLVPNGLIP